MNTGRLQRFMLAFAAFAFVGATGAFAQTAAAQGGGIDVAAMVKELGLSKDKTDAATTVINGLVGQIQESGKALVALLSQKKPEQILDPQVSAKIVQVQKNFALKFEKFKLDLADIAGESNALSVAAKFKALIPVVLLPETAAAPAVVAATAPLSSAAAMSSMPVVQTVPLAMQPAAASKKPVEIPLGSAPMASMPAGTANGGSSLDLSVDVAPGAGSSGGMGMDMMEKGQAMGMDAMNAMPMDSMMPAGSAMPMDSMGNDAAMGSDAAMKGMDMTGMMDKMPKDMMDIMSMMSGGQGMSGGAMSSSGSSGATDPMLAQLLTQLQATNALMNQVISSPGYANSASAQAQVQLLIQLSTSQTALIRQILDSSKAPQAGGSMQSGSMQSGSMPAAPMNMM